MPNNQFSEEQIIGDLSEQEAGAKTVEMCCIHGFSEQTFSQWKSKFGGRNALDTTSAARCPKPSS